METGTRGCGGRRWFREYLYGDWQMKNTELLYASADVLFSIVSSIYINIVYILSSLYVVYILSILAVVYILLSLCNWVVDILSVLVV